MDSLGTRREAEEEDILLDSDFFLLEQKQLQRAEEIQRAIFTRDETIERLRKKLESTSTINGKAKVRIKHLNEELINCQSDNVKLRNNLIETQNELERALSEIQRLRDNEKRLRLELNKCTEDCSSQIEVLKKIHLDGYHQLEDRRNLEFQKIQTLEHALLSERENHQKTRISLQEESSNHKQTQIQLKEQVAQIKQIQNNLEYQVKKTAEFQDKFEMEKEKKQTQLEEIHQETKSLQADLLMVQRDNSNMKEYIEKLNNDHGETEKKLKDKIERITKELKMRTAQVFELENQLNGSVYLAEREKIQIEKQAEEKVLRMTKKATSFQRNLLEKEKLAQEAIQTHEYLLVKIEKLTSIMYYLVLQRNWFLNSVSVFYHGLLKLENRHLPSTRSPNRLKVIVWVIIFSNSLWQPRKKHTSFTWSPNVYILRSNDNLAQRLNEIIFKYQNLIESKVETGSLWQRLVTTEETLKKKVTELQDLQGYIFVLENQVNNLEKQKRQLENEQAKTLEDLDTLSGTINNTESDRRKKVHELEKKISHSQHQIVELENFVEKLQAKLLFTHKQLQHYIKTHKEDNIQLQKLTNEKEDILAELKSTREMMKRLETYAESEIQSLTNILGKAIT